MAEKNVTDKSDDAAKEAYEEGRRIGIDMGPDAILQVLLSHIIATAGDPGALRAQLRSEAIATVRGMNDGKGGTNPFVDGAQAGAIERIASFFGPDEPMRRQ